MVIFLAKPNKKIEAFQSISLWIIMSVPWYVSNHTLYKDLNMESVENLITSHYKHFYLKLLNHSNPLNANMFSATIPDNLPRRFKRHWCRDLLDWIVTSRFSLTRQKGFITGLHPFLNALKVTCDFVNLFANFIFLYTKF